ncbi:MAG: endonuclease/exonuclease/phosphatase family protein [Xanthomonadaceae bacterium]|nr:endonuclease/exonuclease/phosphatase family protein [Xanthomonadaceae bacterium]
MPLPARFVLAALLLCGASAPALAQNIQLTGGTYAQDFDTLSNTAGSTTNSNLPTGWLLNETGGGARDNEQYAVDTGGSNTGDTYSYGAAGSTERALGSLRSGTLIATYGACFNNATGNTLTSFDIAYTGEQWRLGTAARTDRLDFQYSLDATSLSTGTWVDVDTLDFTTPNTATIGAKDGNAAGNRTALSANVGSVVIANGGSFCVRWNDSDASSSDDGLAIDDFSISVGGSASPVVSVNDVSAIEGDSGTTAFFFAFGLSQPAGPGGVTITYSTANGTATAGSDYIATGGTVVIAEGDNAIAFSVLVNGDTTTEADETFFVNIDSVTGAIVADGQGLGTIQNDDVSVVQIHDIQGNGLVSPINGAVVVTEGIVTAQKFNNGFFLQTADANVDADPNTSQGIFVFTSTAPPATAAVGNRVRVSGTVTEFTPSTNLNQLSITEIVSVTGIQVLSTGNALPTPVELTSADFGPTALPGTAEKFEGMRVSVPRAFSVSGSDGNISEGPATSSTTGVFHVTLPGVERPFREPGISVMDVFPVPGGKTPPRFDTNQERLMVRSRGQVGATAVAIDAGTDVNGMVGVLDYFSGTWALLPDAGTVSVSGGKTPTAVADARYEDVTIGGFNLLRFFDEVNDSNGGPTIQAAALDKRLTKTSLAICDYMKAPDILGVVEVENLRVLGLLADRINSTCARAPQYVPYLVQGNDQGGINVGFLVSNRSLGTTNRVEVLEVVQFGKDTLFTNPDSSTSLLNDRPPLMLRARVHQDNGASYPVTVFVNHLRSLNGVDDTGPGSGGWASEGHRVRAKRGQQALYLANLVQARQQANPSEHIVLLGDFNAFEFNDGYVDVMGIVRGDAVPADQVVYDLASPITTPLIDGSDLIIDGAEKYSYVFEGNAQTLDHVVVNEAMLMEVATLSVDHARINADFGVHNYGVAGNAIRVSDHDPVRVVVGVNDFRTADLSLGATTPSANVAAGAAVPFTITVDNAGPNKASFPAVALVFNALVPVTVSAPAGWTCGAPVQAGGTTTVTCTATSLDEAGQAVFTATATAPSLPTASTLEMAASVQSQTRDRANADNSATVSVSVAAVAQPNADTSLRMIGGPYGYIRSGGTAQFSVPVRNTGPNPTEQAVVTFTGNSSIDRTTVVAPSGWICVRNGDGSSHIISCRLNGTFAVNARATFTYTTIAPSHLTQATLNLNSSVNSTGTTDPVPANNSASYSVNIVAP